MIVLSEIRRIATSSNRRHLLRHGCPWKPMLVLRRIRQSDAPCQPFLYPIKSQRTDLFCSGGIVSTLR